MNELDNIDVDSINIDKFENFDNIVIEENSEIGNMFIYGRWRCIIQESNDEDFWKLYYNDNLISIFHKDEFKQVKMIQINNKQEFLIAMLKYWDHPMNLSNWDE